MRLTGIGRMLIGLLTLASVQTACATTQPSRGLATAAVSDLTKLETVGNANWKVDGESAFANEGKGFLVTKEAYSDFSLEVEFRAGAGTNSGLFFRCNNRTEINDQNCYEANIFDTRPDQTYRTGAITTIAAPRVNIDTENGQWHTLEVHANGDRIRIILDGQETVLIHDSRHKEGPTALQFAQGKVQFRNLRIVN